MATMGSFRELLKQATDQVERPKPLAAGHYLGEIKGHEFGQSRNKQTPYVRFILVPEQATADVNVAENDGIELSRRELRKDFYITPMALYRLSDMLDAVLGQETGRSFDDRIPDTRSARVMFAVSQRANEDGTEVFNDIGTIVRAEAA
jgi:hypothetical protein